MTDKVKELLFQTLREKKDYLSLEDLTSVKNDLDIFEEETYGIGSFQPQ